MPRTICLMLLMPAAWKLGSGASQDPHPTRHVVATLSRLAFVSAVHPGRVMAPLCGDTNELIARREHGGAKRQQLTD